MSILNNKFYSIDVAANRMSGASRPYEHLRGVRRCWYFLLVFPEVTKTSRVQLVENNESESYIVVEDVFMASSKTKVDAVVVDEGGNVGTVRRSDEEGWRRKSLQAPGRPPREKRSKLKRSMVEEKEWAINPSLIDDPISMPSIQGLKSNSMSSSATKIQLLSGSENTEVGVPVEVLSDLVVSYRLHAKSPEELVSEVCAQSSQDEDLNNIMKMSLHNYINNDFSGVAFRMHSVKSLLIEL
ncbi:hypothetical protein ACFE04_001512 [Oxalis oulophora]